MAKRAALWLLTASLVAHAADLKSELQTHFRQACDSRKFMGAASVTVAGNTVFSGACGLADAEWDVKNTTRTRFLIASITKEFTAAAVLLLHEEKKFEFSDPIGKYVPNLPESWNRPRFTSF